MREWKLESNAPTNLLLTSDFRIQGAYSKYDNTWELQLEGSDRGGISLYSTLSLRSLSTRIFPVFTSNSLTKIKVSEFNNTPQIRKFSTNFVEFSYSPFEGLDLTTQIWLPDHQTVLSKTNITNNADQPFEGGIHWVMQLTPLQTGITTRVDEENRDFFLSAQSQNSWATFWLSQGAKPGAFSYPSLMLPVQLFPGVSTTHEWVFTCDENPENRFELCKSKPTNAEAFIARMEVLQQRDEIQIFSGNEDWDAVFAFSQKNALQLLLPDVEAGQPAILVKNRNPEQQNIVDYKDFPPIDTLPIFQLWYFLGVVPGAFQTFYQLINRYLNYCQPAEKKINQLPFPMLAEIVFTLYEKTNDHHLLVKAFPILIRFLEQWFTDLHDQDQDGIPEWSHAYQSQVEILPIHNRWHPAGNGIDTRWIESPYLAGLLQHELAITIKIAEILNTSDSVDWLSLKYEVLTKFIHESFHPRKKIYRYRDSITHNSPQGYILYEGLGSGNFKINKILRSEQRLTIKIFNNPDTTRKTVIYIHGKTKQGTTVEEISAKQIGWSDRVGMAASHFVYTKVDSIELANVSADERIEVTTADFTQEDITSIFPLWANNITPQRVKHLIDRWLIPELLQPFGLPYIPVKTQPEESDQFNSVDLIQNRFIIEGLIKHQQLDLALALFENIMQAVIKNLKMFKKFYKFYDASDGYGSGDYNIVNGLIPIETFLKLIGIGFWTHEKIEFTHYNPFPNPIKIQYRATTILCEKDQFRVIFPGGNQFEVNGKLPVRFSIKPELNSRKEP